MLWHTPCPRCSDDPMGRYHVCDLIAEIEETIWMQELDYVEHCSKE